MNIQDNQLPPSPIPLKILAADDFATNRRILEYLLHSMGYEPTMVADGLQVIHALESEKYDVLFLDCQMPIMDGCMTIREIYHRFPVDRRPRIVMLSAGQASDYLDKDLASKVDHCMAKPITHAALHECIRLLSSTVQSTVRTLPTNPALGASASTFPPIFDSQHLKAAFPGFSDSELAEFVTGMQQRAVGDFEHIWPLVQAACRSHSQQELHTATHGLLGCARTMGWKRLASLCEDAVHLSKNGEFKAWDSFPDDLQQLFAESDLKTACYCQELSGRHDSGIMAKSTASMSR